jgi:hypothetical protein
MSIQRIKSGVIADSAVTAAKLDDSTSQLFGFRNRIINGDMRIDQRNAGASVSADNSGWKFPVDRFGCYGSVAGSKFTAQQNAGSVTPPSGFTNYLGITSSSAYTVGASEWFAMRQVIEGFNVADLGWGTANAKSVTLSFWVRSSLTGTFGGAVYNGDGTRSYPFTYSISVADTWEQKSVTIAGDTSGTWLTTNGASITPNFSMGTGATLSGTAGAWAGAFYASATGATSVVGTNAATWYVTGVQLEVGSVATPFERRPYGTELALCQRYYTETVGNARFPAGGLGQIVENSIVFQVTMRTEPTMTVKSGGINSNVLATYPQVDPIDGKGNGARYTLAANGGGDSYALRRIITADSEL